MAGLGKTIPALPVRDVRGNPSLGLHGRDLAIAREPRG